MTCDTFQGLFGQSVKDAQRLMYLAEQTSEALASDCHWPCQATVKGLSNNISLLQKGAMQHRHVGVMWDSLEGVELTPFLG